MERHFLRVVDERRNVGNSNDYLLVCSDYTLVGKPLSLIETLMSRKANEVLKISWIVRCVSLRFELNFMK